jgi:hypothetical protein
MYFGRNVTQTHLARLYLMCQIMHVSYFTVFMIIVASGDKAIDFSTIAKHDFRDFHNRMWAAKLIWHSISPDWNML